MRSPPSLAGGRRFSYAEHVSSGGVTRAGRTLARWLIVLAAAGIALMVAAGTAQATTLRADYVAQADPICSASLNQSLKAGIRTFKKTFGGSSLPGRGAFAVGLGNEFFAIAKILGQATTRLAAIPPPPGDESNVAGWLASRREYQGEVSHAGRAGKHRKLKQMFRILKQSEPGVAAGNQLVADFGFQYCVLPPDQQLPH